MNKNLQPRISNYTLLATDLALLSDQRLEALIETASHLGTSIGGTSLLLRIDNIPIFVKKIRLSDIEKQSQNYMSAFNIFHLPLYYQYGVGSAGFGAWRELAVHTMTTDWVLSGKCIHFPLMYHYRILSSPKRAVTSNELEKMEHDVKYWDGSPAVRDRLLAKLEATTDIVIFLEYFPSNLYDWLGNQVKQGDDIIQSACFMIESELKQTISFMKSHGLLHMDAHFWNILTDGNHIYFTDFGLALSSKFELSEAEIEFFKSHQNYDDYSTITNFLHTIITSLYGQDDWIKKLKECKEDKIKLPSPFQPIIRRYAPITIIMDEFYRKLRFESKNTTFPADNLNNFNYLFMNSLG